MMNINKIKAKLLDIGKDKIRFIILFGSHASGRTTFRSDIDIAAYYDGDKKERIDFRIKALGELPDKIDLNVFQDLPLVVKKEVLKGKLLYYDDYEFLISQSLDVIREFNRFEKHYGLYMKQLEAEA